MVASITPPVCQTQGGCMVTLDGSGFTKDSQVSIDGFQVAAMNVEFISSNQSRFLAPDSTGRLAAGKWLPVKVANNATLYYSQPRAFQYFDNRVNFQLPDTMKAPTNPRDVAVGDMNHDNQTDVAVLSRDSGKLYIFLANSNGSYDQASQVIDAGPEPLAVIAGRFNNDTNLDLAFASSGDDTVHVLLGNGDGTFNGYSPSGGLNTYSVGKATHGANGIVALDFNNDSTTDMAVISYDDCTITLLLGLQMCRVDPPGPSGTRPPTICLSIPG